jgi:tetratricopeptide (TPR) repeat protein
VRRVVAYALVCASLLAAMTTGAEAQSSQRTKRAQAADTTRVPLPDPVIAPDLPRAMAVLDSARAAASADRHTDAIRLYQRAIALYPPLADDIGVELGNQYTWSDQPDSAMIWYQRHLDHHPEDLDAKLGVARLVSWRDDVDQAERLYDEVIAADSSNVDARLGKAQVVNWSGRHREAAGLYRAILADDPDNVDARAGLMQAQRWMGRPDAAVAIADSAPAPVLDGIEADIERSSAPGVSYTYERNEDSDEIKRRYHTFRGGISPNLMTRTSAAYGHAIFEQPFRPDVKRDWFALALERRLSEALALSASAGYQWNSYDRSALGPETYWLDEFNLVIFDAYATLTPRDWTRIDIGLSRGSIDNPDAIFRGISRVELAAGLDQRLRSNLLWISSIESAWYSDDNSSFGLGTRVVWEPLWRLPISLNHRFSSSSGFAYYGFKRTNDNGYYDPRQYLSFYEELALSMTFSERVRARIAGRLSLDKENSDDWFVTGRIEASARWSIWRGLGLSAGYTNSNSRLDSRPGYEIDGFYVTLDYFFW